MIKVMITDDHLLVTDSLSKALAAYDHIDISGIYNTGEALLQALRKQLPDVLLLDVHLADAKDASLAKRILQNYPGIKILIMTADESIVLVRELMEAGCYGYLSKSRATGAILAEALRKVADGELYVDEPLKEKLLKDLLQPGAKRLGEKNKLTMREKEVLQLIAAGLSNRQIADKLCVSLRTIENHRYNLLQKLDEKNAVGLVKAAIRLGLFPEDRAGKE
ncbi:LuxR C-terminal-related transcriptional regulator [Puia dinghuensis]|uniref:DNA-binding response regulator n=1 Tax=Puia dinghuensis TaxID=1792502 RepID=A0A8J2XTA9_9BACT|nr:response regulator transcription factor [Puia dinghuensis]GGB02590.1 DNA-binding response regulator [Puia dinghuensis]